MATIKNYNITVFMPVFNMAKTIKRTLQSVLDQTYPNFEIIIRDNASIDDTVKIINSFKSPKIKLFHNPTNLDYMGNLNKGIKDCHRDIVLLLAGDDILAKNALEQYNHAFHLLPDIGAVTRPYYWFIKDVHRPVRTKKQLSQTQDTIVHITDNFSSIREVFSTLDQLSGLALRLKYIDRPFGSEGWISHAYPFVSIFSKHPIVFLKNYTVAVYIGISGTRVSAAYDFGSPMMHWIKMVSLSIDDPRQKAIRNRIIKDFIAVNYVGLLQIKNFSNTKNLYREIFYLIKYRPENLINLKFWFFTLYVILVPKKLSLVITDWYKEKINSKFIEPIEFPY